MNTPSPDPATADGPLRRRYFAWGRRMLERRKLPPEQIEYLLSLERFIYSRAAIGGWLAAAALAALAALGLHANGASWPAAAALGAAGVFLGLIAMLSGWVQPERYSARKLWTIAALMVVVTFASRLGAPLPAARLEGLSGWTRVGAALDLFWQATPFQLIAGLVIVLMLWASSLARRHSLQRELAQARAEQALDAAARQLAQARLSLLQAQIQPHFLFNTLAALQHWVDGGDARAAPLLRALTGFLRGSTELMLKDGATLAEEAEMARHYLSIMRSRLGERLRFSIEIAPDCAAQQLPPGIVITLVENAVEHGIEPRLHGGEVRLIAQRDAAGAFELRVTDDGVGLPPGGAAAGGGVGLANSRERLRHQFGARATLALAAPASGRGAEALLRIEPAAP